MDYVLKSGEPLRLPRYADANTLRLAIPRPDTALAGTLPHHRSEAYRLTGMLGQLTAEMTYGPDDCAVMPQVGYHSPVHLESFSTEHQPSGHLPYRRGNQVEVTSKRPIASVLAPLWGPGAPIFEVYRQLPALIYGQVPDDVTDTWWLTTDTGIWQLLPGSYIIREMNGYGGRIMPHTFFIREFRAITELTGDVVEEFDLPKG